MANKVIKEMEIKFGPVSLKVVDGKIDPGNFKDFITKSGEIINGDDVIEVVLPDVAKPSAPGLPVDNMGSEAVIGDEVAIGDGEAVDMAAEISGEEKEAGEAEEETGKGEEEEGEEEGEEEEGEEKESKNPFVSSEDINKIASLITEDINTNNGMKFKKK